MCARLVRLEIALVALERPDGLLIERLLDAGLAVVAVHPNQVRRSARATSVAGGKSDSFDSFVLAQLARTDSHRIRVLVPDSDRTKALRAMTRAREGLVRTRGGLANQLRDQLACFWPGASKATRRVRHPRGLKPPAQPWAADMYNRARARGASHPHAARILGRAWCQVIWRLSRDHDAST